MEMFRKAITSGLIGLTALAMSVSALAVKPGETDGDPAFNGNGAPSGPHYNLNLIGKEWIKGQTTEPVDTNGNGHRIFVMLGSNGTPKTTKIMLGNSGDASDPCNGKDFCVTDYDGTDGWAEFFLPNPDDDCNGVTDWSVYARAVGNSGNKAEMWTCAKDGDYLYCGEEIATFESNGRPKFTNVSRELFYVRVDNTRYSIFGDSGYEYWWEYKNYGLRLAQLRFYEISTIIDDLGEDTLYACDFPTTTTTTLSP
jgi:hypothetical protein